MPKKLDVTNAFYDLLVSKTTVITRDIYRIFPSVQTFYDSSARKPLHLGL